MPPGTSLLTIAAGTVNEQYVARPGLEHSYTVKYDEKG
jgi:hypothetical protein